VACVIIGDASAAVVVAVVGVCWWRIESELGA
jgi:hypothetical protein